MSIPPEALQKVRSSRVLCERPPPLPRNIQTNSILSHSSSRRSNQEPSRRNSRSVLWKLRYRQNSATCDYCSLHRANWHPCRRILTYMKAWGKCTNIPAAHFTRFLLGDKSWRWRHLRFVHTPTDAINSRLVSENETLKKDISDLEKRLHYLETTYEKSREHIEQIFRGSGA